LSGPTAGIATVDRPILATRILPRGNGALDVLALAKTFATTQKLMLYAGHEEVRGPNPDLSGIRSTDKTISAVSRLEVWPQSFKEGSFVIEASLPDAEVVGQAGDGQHRVTSRDVLRRFSHYVSATDGTMRLMQLPIGVLQALEDFRMLVGREAEQIEFRSILLPDDLTEAKPVVLTIEHVRRVSLALTQRRTGEVGERELEGVVSAVDLQRGTLKLQTANDRTIPGTFSDLVRQPLARSLGLTVRVFGITETQDGEASFIRVLRVEPLEEGF